MNRDEFYKHIQVYLYIYTKFIEKDIRLYTYRHTCTFKQYVKEQKE